MPTEVHVVVDLNTSRSFREARTDHIAAFQSQAQELEELLKSSSNAATIETRFVSLNKIFNHVCESHEIFISYIGNSPLPALEKRVFVTQEVKLQHIKDAMTTWQITRSKTDTKRKTDDADVRKRMAINQ